MPVKGMVTSPMIGILMYQMENNSLEDYIIRGKGGMNMKEVMNLVTGAAKGVEYAHSKHMIHNDIAARFVFKRVQLSFLMLLIV